VVEKERSSLSELQTQQAAVAETLVRLAALSSPGTRS
jgi:hypothetical protein